VILFIDIKFSAVFHFLSALFHNLFLPKILFTACLDTAFNSKGGRRQVLKKDVSKQARKNDVILSLLNYVKT